MIDSDIARVREALDLIPRGIIVAGDVEDALNRLAERLQEAQRERDEWRELAQTNAVEVNAWRARNPLAAETREKILRDEFTRREAALKEALTEIAEGVVQPTTRAVMLHASAALAGKPE